MMPAGAIATGRPRSSLAAQHWVPLVMVLFALLASAALFAAATPPMRSRAGGAERYVAPDGRYVVLAGGDKRLHIETARATGAVAFANGLPAFAFAAGGMDVALRNHFAYERMYDGEQMTERALMFTPEGIKALGEINFDGLVVYQPTPTRIPANPQPGMRWSDSGMVFNPARRGSAQPFTIETSITAADNDCLVFHSTERRGSDTRTEEVTRCPNQGIVRLDQYTEPAELGLASDASTVAETPTWSDQPRLDQVRRTGAQVSLNPNAGMVSITTGQVVANMMTEELVWIMTTTKGIVGIPFTRKPGGDVTGLGGFGDIVVAATSGKQLVAYDSVGRRVWTSPTDDVVFSVVRLSDDRLVTRSYSGVVAAHDLRTGERLWTHRPGPGAPTAPTVVGSAHPCVVVSIDDALSCLDPASGKVRWTTQLQGRIEKVDGNDHAVVAVTQHGVLTSHDVHDGSVRWTRELPDNDQQAIARLDQNFVVVSPVETRLVDASTGADLKTYGPAKGAVRVVSSEEPRVLLLHENQWRILAADGSVASQGQAPGTFHDHTVALAAEGQLAALTFNSFLVQWRPQP